MKQSWKPGNMVYPLPAVLVTCRHDNIDNVFTVAWTGTICTNPPMVYISVRPERYSYDLIKESGVFTINLTTKELVKATDFCGVRSGRNVDKFKEMNLEKEQALKIDCPILTKSPVNIECRVKEILELGSHHMFIADVLNVQVDEACLEENGRLALEKTKPIVYSHGEYYDLGNLLGTFGYSVRKKRKKK
ncbi:MAG: flavin reductase family protein [Erysipelotrichaceae bacterium]|uniref:flavin reductase family protein n=1 Tax=Floccifex sp. TaxID=2815810 RepID=UPI0029FF3EB9|nr:flavin reductase [Floccifex sp.]MDD7281169.1 flavin reductase family protein [Erysipelotrichaceae bacterium]MDY2958803.1 flavin reductase family protein [Floccifex sp.]